MMVRQLLVLVEASGRPMGRVGNVCYFCQASYHRHCRSIEISNAVLGSVDGSKCCEACVLYDCAALEKWGEEVHEIWVGNGERFCFEDSHDYSTETREAYLLREQVRTAEGKLWGQRSTSTKDNKRPP